MYLGICNVLRTYSKTINNLVEILGFEIYNPGTHWEILCLKKSYCKITN